MTTSVEEVCKNILQNPKPLIFLDTCIILNVINALHSGELAEDYINHVLKITELQNNTSIWLTTAENVREEYFDNIEIVMDTAKKNIDNIFRQIRVMQSFQNSIENTSISPPDFKPHNLRAQARKVAERFLNSCLIAKREEIYSVRAMNRVRQNTPPARRGGREAKDCEIVECLLDIANKLRGENFNGAIVFITANTKDYGKSGRLPEPLHQEFQNLNIDYANYLDHAIRLCGLR